METFSEVKKIFIYCTTKEDRYRKIIELGKSLPPLDKKFKIEENLVKGCQSIVYLHSELQHGKMIFSAFSDALISAGLAALLIKAYQGNSPEFILKEKPTFLEELNIFTSLSPNRSNGLANIYLRMQKDAIKFFQTLQKG